jgi:hypothetical protein
MMPNSLRHNAFAALALARIGDSEGAEARLNGLSNLQWLGTDVYNVVFPSIRAAIHLDRKNPAAAVDELRPAIPYDLGTASSGLTLYYRGLAYLEFEKVYSDKSTPKEVRRRILEASVRAPQTWHQDAIRHAYSGGDKEWVLAAVFSMRWVRGFDDQILQALKSEDPEINYQAVIAAGNWELDGAWPHIVELVKDAHCSKPLLLAAIGALSGIRPAEARDILEDLAESDDEEIAEAVSEAMAAIEGPTGEEDDEEDKWVN